MIDPRIEKLVKQYTTQNITLSDLGAQEGVSRERIRQLLKIAGVSAKQSYRKLSRSAQIERDRYERREQRCQSLYGCDYAALRKVIGGRPRVSALRAHPLAKRWHEHKTKAKRIRIPWEFTFPEYAELVGPRILEIGLSKGALVLGRKDKNGPFSKANCELVTLSDNSRASAGFVNAQLRKQARAQKNAQRARSMYDAGHSNTEIAKALKKSKATISKYLRRTA